MWYALGGDGDREAKIDTGRFRFCAVTADIESLNRRAETAELEITAVSIAQYPRIAQRYALTACGASMGDGYGPRIVARSIPDDPIGWLRAAGRTLAVPGRRTSAFLTTALMLGGFERFCAVVIPFREIIPRVAAGEFDAGLVIHEGQLTFQEQGLHLLIDLGQWWLERTGLPLPLGGNAIRRDLVDRFGPGTLEEITSTLGRSLEYALQHRAEALGHASRFACGLDETRTDQFVSMYVNRHTLTYGPRGREAVMRFLTEACQLGLVGQLPADLPHFVEAAPVPSG